MTELSASLPQAVAEEHLHRSLGELGIRDGDLVFVHSAMRPLGPLPGGANGLLAALQRAVGPRGTVAVPVFHRFFLAGPSQVWDQDHSPSRMGIFSEIVRTTPNAHRSSHPSHPVAALGPHGRALAAHVRGSPFGPQSSIRRLVEQDALILLLGVGFEACTLLHSVEEYAAVPYRSWCTLSGTVVTRGRANHVSIPFYRLRAQYRNRLAKCGLDLEKEGGVRRVALGQGEARATRASTLFSYVAARVQQNPYYMARPANPAELGVAAIRRGQEWGRKKLHRLQENWCFA